MMPDLWPEWVLDVTFSPRLPPCFCPYEADHDRVVVGMSYLGDKPPGKIVGVFHSDGPEACEAWINDNKDWRERYAAEGEAK